MGAAVPAAIAIQAAESASDPADENDESDALKVRGVVLNALTAAGHQMLVSMLEGGEWQVAGNEVRVKVAASPSVIDMTLGAEAKRVATASASGAMGLAVRFNVVAGAAQPSAAAAKPGASNGGGRSRAEMDPVVRRIQEKFGAEIRTVIDYQQKK
jgi:hypothetical protein